MYGIGWFFFFLFTPMNPQMAVSLESEANVHAKSSLNTALPEKRISTTLAKLESLWEVAAKAYDQKRRFTESQEVLQDERLEWMAQRDRLTVTLQGMGRQLVARENRLRDLTEVLYKLAHAQPGPSQWRSRWVHPLRNGRFLVMLLLERELAERRKIKEEINLLHARRTDVDRNIEELQKLEENFRLMALDAENLVNRSLFEIRELETRLEGVNKNTFDAVDWQRYAHIQRLRAAMKNPSSTLAYYKGMMLKPVVGPVMPVASSGTPPLSGVMYAAAPGVPVRATHDGTVRFVGPLEGYGTVIVIEHEFDIHSIIGRVDSPNVKPGVVVRRGQVIARTPDGPPSAVRPVYLELRRGREKLDVSLWMNKNF